MVHKQDQLYKTKTKISQEPRSVQYDTTTRKPNSQKEINTKLASQTSKSGLIQRFGEDIGYLVLGSNIAKLDIPFLLVISQKVVSDINMFGFGVKYGIFGNTDGTCAITQKRHSRKAQTKITQGVSHPQNLRATASDSNIFSFSSRLCSARLFTRRP